MKSLVLLLRPTDTREAVEAVLADAKEKEVVLLCPRENAFLQNAAELATFKNFLEDADVSAIFVQPQSILRNIIAGAGMKTTALLPEHVKDLPQKTVFELNDSVEALRNPTMKHRETSPTQAAEAPLFVSSPIEDGPRYRHLRGRIFFGLILVVGVLAMILYYISPSATLELRTRVHPLQVTQNVIVLFAGKEPPEEESKLPRVPGIAVSTVITGREIYPTTDVAYEIANATGQVLLYNETPEPKTFIPSRLMTETGEVFRFNEQVRVPGRTADGPGQLAVTVTADPYDEAGEPIGRRGNIAAGTKLFFPALKEDSRAQYYAEAALGPLLRGDTLERYFLGEADEEGGRRLFTESYTVRAFEQLQQEIDQRSLRDRRPYALIDEPTVQGVELTHYAFPRTDIGTEQETYTVEGTLRVSGVVFDQLAIIEALEEKLELNRDGRMRLLEVDEESLDYRIINADNLSEEGWLKLSVSMVGLQALDLSQETEEAQAWKDNLKQQIIGRRSEYARSIIGNYPEVEEVIQLSLRPFWARTLPLVPEQLTIKARYE